MIWDNLPDDIIKIIMYFRKLLTCGNGAATYIQSRWKSYKTRVLIGRFRLLRYLREFRELNPTLIDFLLRSRL